MNRSLTTRPAHSTLRPVGAAVLVALLASGCSILQEDKIDYKGARPVSTLEVPPDLTQLSRDSRYNLPANNVTASGFEVARPAPATQTAVSQLGDVRIERAGNQRWLVVDRAPEQLWSTVHGFWQENGFQYTLDQERLGLLETDWAENRAKLPHDVIRSTLGKVFDSLYSTGERDKFRTRLERNPSGGTDIFISHRGMVEVYTSERDDQTVWQPRQADPELEAEFLRRLMVKLGVSSEQSKALIAGNAVPPSAVATTVNGQTVVQINEGFDRAWRRVGLALDRTGFTVEDRDRSQGIYHVRYVAPVNPDGSGKKSSWFSGWFGGGKNEEATPNRYRVVVTSAGAQSTVSVQDANGAPAPAASAQRIVKVLVDDLK